MSTELQPLRDLVQRLRTGDWNLRSPQEMADMIADQIEAAVHQSAGAGEPVARVIVEGERETVDVGFVDWIGGRSLKSGTLLYAHPAPAGDATQGDAIIDVESMAHAAFEEAMAFGVSSDNFIRLAKKVATAHLKELAEAQNCIDTMQKEIDSLKAATQGDAGALGDEVKRLRRIIEDENDHASVFTSSSYVVPTSKALEAFDRLAALAQQPAKEAPAGWQFDLDEAASGLLKQVIGDDDTVSRVTLSLCDGHEGRGLYVWLTDYPEEGSLLLSTSPAAAPAPQAEQAAQADVIAADWLHYVVTLDDDELSACAAEAVGRATATVRKLRDLVRSTHSGEKAAPAPTNFATLTLTQQGHEVWSHSGPLDAGAWRELWCKAAAQVFPAMVQATFRGAWDAAAAMLEFERRAAAPVGDGGEAE